MKHPDVDAMYVNEVGLCTQLLDLWITDQMINKHSWGAQTL